MRCLEDFFKPQKPWEVEGVEWRKVRLGDKNYFHIETGATPKTSVREYWENGAIKWVTPKDLGKNNGIFIYDTERKITESGLNSCSTTVIPKGSIIISTRAPIGHIAILGDDMCFNQGCKGLVIKDSDITSKFIYYALLIKIDLMKMLGSGPTFEELSKDKLTLIKIPLPFRNGKPDLETQKKIVEYIEVNFSKIDKILEKKKKEFEKLNELWESVLEQAFKPKEGEEWREIKLNEICSKIIDREHNTPKYAQEGIPLISPQNFTEDGFSFENVKYIDLKSYEKEVKRVNPEKGDILFSRIGTIGQVRIVNTERKFIPLHSIVLIKPKKEVVFNKYLAYFLNTHKIKKISWKHVKKVGTPDLGIKIIRNFPIQMPFRNNQPDLEKQREIANYLDSVYEKLKTLKQKIQNQITQLEEMKESILDEVFNHDESYCS